MTKWAVEAFTSLGSTGVYISLIGKVISTVGDDEFKVLLGLKSIWKKQERASKRGVARTAD